MDQRANRPKHEREIYKTFRRKSLQPWVREIFLGAQNPSYKRKK